MTLELDPEGYPTEATLTAIREWPINGWSDVDDLLCAVQGVWTLPTYFLRHDRRRRAHRSLPLERRWSVSTGGWSGNESLIDAMQSNVTFWTLSWESTHRGGHYKFRSR